MFITNPIFIILAATGAVFIVVGLYMLKNPPRKINDWYGYRSSGSKKSQARWDFAQLFSSRFMMKVGQVLIIISVPAAYSKIDPVAGSIISILIILASAIFLIARTERAIRDKFGAN